GGESVRLTQKLTMQGAVSPDGKQIAVGYRPDTQAAWKLALFSIEGGQPTRTYLIPQSVELPIVVRFSPDGRSLTYVDTGNGVSNLWLQPIADGPARKLSNWTSDQVYSFAWARDGKRIAVARGSRSDDVVLIRDLH